MIRLTPETVRKETIRLSCRTGAGHLAPSLSCVEILTVLFNSQLRFNPSDPYDESRDRLILSKGHGCYAYYVILNSLGIIPDAELDNFYTSESSLKGCLVKDARYMLEASTGSLGHGLPISAGMALGFRMNRRQNLVYCVTGDGEMQEGSNYEALQFAVRFGLDNLCIVIDANGLQAMEHVGNVGLTNARLAAVLRAYVDNGHFIEIDGHNAEALEKAYEAFRNNAGSGLPTIIFCHTVKGKGISMMENEVKYHFRCPVQDGYSCE